MKDRIVLIAFWLIAGLIALNILGQWAGSNPCPDGQRAEYHSYGHESDYICVED